MARPFRAGWLVAAGPLLGHPAAYGQTGTEVHSDTAETGAATLAASKNVPDLARVKRLILQATNKFRASQGRGELKENEALDRAAQGFAEYMARTDRFGHTVDGKQPWERVTAAGYQYSIVLENIAWEYNSAGFSAEQLARAFVRGWENSPPHRKNLLDPDVRDLGVGVARSAKTGRWYAVQDFGRPRSEMVEFRISNRTDAPVNYAVDGKSFTAEPNYTITHQRARPPELRFQWPEGAAVAPAAREPFHPGSGSRFEIRKDDSGAFTVEAG